MIWLAVLVAAASLGAVLSVGGLYGQYWHQSRVRAEAIADGEIARGKRAITRRGCAACHVIPDIHGAVGKVAPDHTHVGLRASLAGELTNDPEEMVRWLMHPQQVAPGSAMPEMGLSQAEARDIAAYLHRQD